MQILFPVWNWFPVWRCFHLRPLFMLIEFQTGWPLTHHDDHRHKKTILMVTILLIITLSVQTFKSRNWVCVCFCRTASTCYWMQWGLVMRIWLRLGWNQSSGPLLSSCVVSYCWPLTITLTPSPPTHLNAQIIFKSIPRLGFHLLTSVDQIEQVIQALFHNSWRFCQRKRLS